VVITLVTLVTQNLWPALEVVMNYVIDISVEQQEILRRRGTYSSHDKVAVLNRRICFEILFMIEFETSAYNSRSLVTPAGSPRSLTIVSNRSNHSGSRVLSFMIAPILATGWPFEVNFFGSVAVLEK